MCQPRMYRLTLVHYRDQKQIGEPVEVPVPPSGFVVHDGDVWEVIRTQTQLPHPRETLEEAREPIEVLMVVGEANDMPTGPVIE